MASALADRVAGPPRPLAQTFAAIYHRNAWGDAESRSGGGSTQARASDFLDDLLALCRSLDVRSIVDVPCGDFNWARPLADAVDRYTGIDIVPDLIARNQAAHGSETRSFLVGDLTHGPLPPADLVLCRDCLVHLSLDDAVAALDQLVGSPSRYLVLTTFVDEPDNRDIRSGGWRPLNLERPPFGLPPPAFQVDERCMHSGGRYRDKRLAVWETATLASRSRPV